MSAFYDFEHKLLKLRVYSESFASVQTRTHFRLQIFLPEALRFCFMAQVQCSDARRFAFSVLVGEPLRLIRATESREANEIVFIHVLMDLLL